MNNLVLGAAALNFEGIKLPFTVNDLVSSGGKLLGIVAGFVLLGLAFWLAKELIFLISTAFSSSARQSANMRATRRAHGKNWDSIRDEE